jgi:AhpD family alkylhydroperoxidase
MAENILYYDKKADENNKSHIGSFCNTRELSSSSHPCYICLPGSVKAARTASGLKHTGNFKSACIFNHKTKTLLQLSLAAVLQCPVCTKLHMKNALASGATSQELTEALFLATNDLIFTEKSKIVPIL